MNKNAYNMSPEELRQLADEKENEEKYIVMVATVKHDLYWAPSGKIKIDCFGYGFRQKNILEK